MLPSADPCMSGGQAYTFELQSAHTIGIGVGGTQCAQRRWPLPPLGGALAGQAGEEFTCWAAAAQPASASKTKQLALNGSTDHRMQL